MTVMDARFISQRGCKRMIKIEDYIPVGYYNRVTREQLQKRTGLSDRKIRELISESRELIINVDNGYFVPDERCMYDRELVNLYYHREKKRAESLLIKIRKYKHMTNGKEYRIPLTV